MLKVIYKEVPMFGQPVENPRVHSFHCEHIRSMSFPVGGFISVHSEDGVVIASGFLRKNKRYLIENDERRWMFAPSMLKKVEDFTN